MPIAGERPESGVRIVIERARSREDPPFSYAGRAHLPDVSFPLAVLVAADGEVMVTVSPDERGATPPPELAAQVRLIVRTVWRQASADGEPPAWRIVRWRGDK